MLLGSAYGKIGLDSSGVMSGVQNAVSALKNFKSTMELAGGGLNKLKANLDTAKSAVAAARIELEKLKAGGAAKEQIEGAAKSLKTLEANAKTAATAVRNAEGQMQQLRQAGMQLGQAMQQVGNMLTVAVTLPLIAAGGAAIKLASDYNETASKSKVVFEEMADSVIKNAKKADAALGLSAKKYLDYSSSIAAALKAGGMGIKQSTELSEQAVKHFADLASFHNAQVEDVAVAWQSAIRGQYEPIQKYFPFITNEYLKTYGTAKNLIAANTENLTANQRAIILNAIAQDEKLNPAIDDFAETAGGLANQTRIAQAELENALQTLGQNLLPIALQAVKALNGLLAFFNSLPPSAQKGILVMLGFVAALGPVLSILGSLLMFVIQLQMAWPMLVEGAASLGIALPALGTGLAGVGTAITTTVMPAIGAFLVAAAPIVLTIGLVVAAVGLLYWAFSTNFNGITDTVKMLGVIIAYYAKKWWADLVDGAAKGWQKFTDYVKRVVQTVVNLFKLDWGAIGRNIIMGIAIGIISKIVDIVNAARKAATAALDAFRNALGIHSQSTKFNWAGRMSGLGYVNGLGASIDPEQIARVATRPVQSISRSAQQSNTYQFSSGLTIREAREMQAESLRRVARLEKVLGLGGA